MIIKKRGTRWDRFRIHGIRTSPARRQLCAGPQNALVVVPWRR